MAHWYGKEENEIRPEKGGSGDRAGTRRAGEGVAGDCAEGPTQEAEVQDASGRGPLMAAGEHLNAGRNKWYKSKYGFCESGIFIRAAARLGDGSGSGRWDVRDLQPGR